MLLAAGVTAVVTGVLTPALARWARRRQLLDVPNHRSSHRVATPRLGGVAMIAGVLAGIAISSLSSAPGPNVAIVLGGAVVIGVVGLVDDVRHLPAVLRLVMHVAVALAVVSAVPATWPAPNLPPFAATGIAVLWIVALTNAFNFMDGIDGIAGLQALIGGAGWTAVGLLTGTGELVMLGLLMAAASAGFLLYNWHPASVFMGDAGSGFFGFLFGAMPLLAGAGEAPAWLAGVFLMWPFLFDTGFTLLRRASRGENVLAAHRSHVYQRLIVTGGTHSAIAALYGGLALLGALAAVTSVSRKTVPTVMLGAAIAAAAVLVWRTAVTREADGPRRAEVR